MAGNITAYPLAAFSTRTLPGSSLLLDLTLVPSEAALESGEERRSLPIAMTAEQAREVAQALLAAATATEMGNAPTTSRN